MKKQLLLLLVMILLPMVASADAVEINGIYYNLIEKAKVAEVTSNPNKYTGSVSIPEKVTYMDEVYSVASIGESAFANCKGLTSVSLPNCITTIDWAAFCECSGLKTVNIPEGITTISASTFLGCSSLASINIPNSVTTIENSSFRDCTALVSITIPSSVKNIRSFAFYGCSGLTSVHISDIAIWCGVNFEDIFSNPLYLAHHLYLGDEEITDLTIPDNISSIGNNVFAGFSGLNSVIIPNNITTIGRNAFFYCTGLTSVNIPNSVTTISSGAFQGCSALTSVNIPSSLTKIEEGVFENCTSLTSVIVPNCVTQLDDGAFMNCSNLSTVTLGSGIKSIWNQVFANCKELSDVFCMAINVPYTVANAFDGSYIEYATLHVPENSIDSYKETEPWKNFKNIIKIDMPKHKLTYILDGETYKTYEIEEGETITPEPAPTKEGHTFSGWSEIPATMPAHDVTVTGTFSVNKYKLIYKVDGADYKSYEIEYGAAITPEAAPTKEGYTFSGWSEIPATMPAHDVTVTGTFSVNKYKLIYKVDGADYKSYEIEYGAAITPEAAPTKEGYTFSGWSEIPATMPAHDVTVTGTFSVNKYKLIYKVDGADYKSYEIEYGAAITPEPAPTKEGHTFSGWSEIPATMPAHDVTVTGTFTQVVYVVDNVSYEVSGDNVSVTDGTNYSGEVVLESSVVINGQSYTVNAIADEAFKGNQNITSVIIPNSVTTIGSSAFEECTKLSTINIGNAVVSIGSKAFANMSGASQAPRRASGNGLMVQCNTESVPSTASDAFANTPINNATLLVLDNFKTSYMNTTPWSGFGKIMGINEYTGIEAIIVDIESGAKIYSLDGKPQDTLQKGVNIVRTSNGKTKKVAIK